MTLVVLAGTCAASISGFYAASWFAEIRGIHDWMVPGAVWRARKPHVVMTFDDGPDPETTPRILDVLDAHGAKAVFFVLGRAVEKYPQIVRRIAAGNHQIGNHSWSHPWMIVSSGERIRLEIVRCQCAVEDAIGQAPVFARPPYGQKDFRYYRIARELALTPVLWSRNLRDYWGSSALTLQRRLRTTRPGDIVLLHDGDRKARHTAAALDAWLRHAPRVGPL